MMIELSTFIIFDHESFATLRKACAVRAPSIYFFICRLIGIINYSLVSHPQAMQRFIPVTFQDDND